MAFLSWTPQYQIGDATIDAEHQELFRLVNAFHDQWLDKRDRQTIAPLLNQLINYTQMHFRHEEQVMLDAGYAKLAEHQQVHESMIDTIFTLQQSFEDKNNHLEMDTLKFIKSWLVDHVLENDFLFRDFLAHKKPAAAAAEAPE
jgi:hemerythrin